MSKMEFSGKTLDDALEDAAKALGIEKSAVSYSVVQTPKGGLLQRLFARGVRIEAWAETSDALTDAARDAVREIMGRKSQSRAESSVTAPEKGNTERAPRRDDGRGAPRKGKPTRGSGNVPELRESSSQPRPSRSSGERKAVTDGGGRSAATRPERRPKAAQALRDSTLEMPPRNLVSLASPEATAVFDEFTGAFLRSFEITSENCNQTRDETGNVTLTIEDPYLEGVLAKSDRLSLAFEHIFKRVAQKKIGDVGGRVYLSAGKADEVRQEALRDFAFSLADKVKRTGKAITVASKTSQERRVIHLTLDSVSGVATRSVGSGDRRRLIVYSTEARARSTSTPRPAEAGEGVGTATTPRSSRSGQGKKRRGRGGRRPDSVPTEPSSGNADGAS